MKRKIFGILFFMCFLFLENCTRETAPKLRFAFMTDIHLNYNNERDCFSGLEKALDTVQKYNVDFIMLGGDCVDVDGLGGNLDRADSLYAALKNILDKHPAKIYPAIGNHDRFFDTARGYKEGDELFKKFFRDSYYTFEQKGIRFFVLNSVQIEDDSGDYTEEQQMAWLQNSSPRRFELSYYVGEQQMEWLQNNLKNISAETPVVVITHVPVYSIYYPVVEGKYVFVDIIANYQKLLKTFENHNLQLVLQGHQHLYEEIYSRGVQYITGGAISAGWWRGAFWDTEEGFLIVDVDGNNNFTWNYVDYGWTVGE